MENGVTRVNTIPYHQLTVFHCHTKFRMSIHQAGKNVNKGRNPFTGERKKTK
jgi:hypothetical protein